MDRALDRMLGDAAEVRRMFRQLSAYPFADLQRLAAEATNPLAELYRAADFRSSFAANLLSGPHLSDALAAAVDIIADRDRMVALWGSGVIEAATSASEAAQLIRLPTFLDFYRPTLDEMVPGLAMLEHFRIPSSTENLLAFSSAAAWSRLSDTSTKATESLVRATAGLPSLQSFAGSMADYRVVLNAAGLILPRWPRIRRLSSAEKQRRFRAKLQGNAEPAHVRRAKSLVHRYEITLRAMIDDLMSTHYGYDWVEDRLLECGCKDLLAKWRKRGEMGYVLDHADYAHYGRIIGHPEHFAVVFKQGFDGPDDAIKLFKAAGDLRAASHHARDFTPDDLRDLRAVWLTIEKALIALDQDYDVEE